MTFLHAPPSLVIFESEGVLVNTDRIVLAHLAEALSAEGLALDYVEARRRYLGLTLPQVVASAEAELGRALPEGWRAKVEPEMLKRIREEARPVPGAIHALLSIQAAGVKTYICSAGSSARITAGLGTVGLLPRLNPRLLSAENMGMAKADLFAFAARVCGLSANRAIVIEASVPGIEGALGANIRVASLVSEKVPSREDLYLAGARVFDNMEKLPEMLAVRSLPKRR